MKKVFFCPECGYVGAAEEDAPHLCPRCGKQLLRNTGMDRDAYVALSPEAKAAAAEGWKAECGREPAGTRPAGKNRIALLLRIIGIAVYVLAAISGIALLFDEEIAGVIVLISGLISGTMFLGFAEIIRLLDVISKKN